MRRDFWGYYESYNRRTVCGYGGNRYPVTETGFQKLMEKLIQYGL